MLSERENELLTRVGPGTLMGDLLRRYWTPACLSEELPEPGDPPVRVRLLGEDLVAFRDTSGRVGLVAENCSHRGASLFFGRNEDCGLRCSYHGWKFDVDGTCVDIPSEPPTEAIRNLKSKARITAYPTHESGGLVWTYMGPTETITPFRDFGTETLAPEHVSAGKLHSRCNWVQALESNLDTTHISYLHQYDAIDDIPDDGSDQPGYPTAAMSWRLWRHDRSPRLEVQDDWFGFRYAGIRTTPNGHTHARVTAYVVPYTTIIASIPFSTLQQLFVPIDDESCWRYYLATQSPSQQGTGRNRFFTVDHPFEFPASLSGIMPREYTAENDYRIDREVQRTATFSGIADFHSQDLMVTETAGAIYDRTKEHLGGTDRAIIRMRKILLSAAKGLPDGQEPPAVGPEHDYRRIRSAEKILEPGEDWRTLGTDDDPAVRRRAVGRPSRIGAQAR